MLDVVDRSHDGKVTWEDYRIFLKAVNLGDESAKAVFALLDKDNSGNIDRRDHHRYDQKFWFELDDPDVRGMFGDKFE